MKMRSYSSLSMKFLLAIGIVSTAFSLFLIHQTWKSSHESLHHMLSQQAELAMAFDIAMQEVNEICPESPADGLSEVCPDRCRHNSETVKEVFSKVQETHPQVIIHSSGKQLSKILNQSCEDGEKIYRFFEQNPTQEALDRILKFNGLNYLAKFRLDRDDISITDLELGLRMIAIPLEGYQSRLNEMTMYRFSKLMIALLILLGAIYLSFNLFVTRPVDKIINHFREIASHDEEVCFEPLDIRSKDEIGILAGSFNGLGQKLQTLFETLELQVRKRTCELQQANRNLRHKMYLCRRAEDRAKDLAHQATSANRAKSEFLANMSHELRTPMNAIVGFSQVLSEEMSKKEHVIYVNHITGNSQKLLSLIDQLLEFSKLEAGKMDVEIRGCAIGSLVQEVESLMRPEAVKKNLSFEFLQCDPTPEMIYTDPQRLRQCMIYLVDNAIKFTEAGHVYVNISMKPHDDNSILRFDVEDTGIGISEEHIPIIFDSFTQADGAMTRKYGGTGVGLAITKNLVERLGGKISVRSQQGRGSVFSIEIPTGVKWPTDEDAIWNKYFLIDEINEMDHFEKGQKMFNGKILVAEDNPSNQKLIAILLEKMGFEVTLADDGVQAMEQCGNQTFDIILMDMQMPNMNGYDATRQLRSQGVKTPIIAVTANAMMGDEEKCMEVGCDGYLSKPIDRNILQDLISQHLSIHVG